jgi:prepilin-type N-terminal cleavage/methylation domain-containing protein
VTALARRGFTIVELLVALSAGALLLAALYGIVASVMDAGETLVAARREAELSRQGHRWLRSIIASTSVGQPGDAPFEGGPASATFMTMMPSAHGWHEPRAIDVRLDGDSLLASVTGAEAIVLRRGVRAVNLDYLLEPGASAHWVRQWRSPVSAPLALRVRIDLGGHVDTALYLIGPRG